MGQPLVAEPQAVSAADSLLRQILASPNFQRAPALSRLLLYLWDRRSEPPSEYSIGIDVFGKPADFDPKLDATIRVHVSRLRQKLRDYSQATPEQPLRLTLPSGSLRLHLDSVEIVADPGLPQTRPQLEPVPARKPDTRYRTISIVFGVLAALLLVTAGLLSFRLRQVQSSTSQSLAPNRGLPAFWQRTLGNGKLTRIIFPTPVFVSSGPLRVRDVTVSDPDDLGGSADLGRILPAAKKPLLSYSYSVANDTLALATLLPVLSNRGLPITVNSTRDFSLERFASDNLIFLGIPPTSEHVARLLSKNHFYVSAGSSAVSIRDPTPSESQLPLRDSYDTARRFGILAVIPGEAANTRLVLLCGRHSEAVASYLASPITLQQLEVFLSRQGNPEYFEMLVEAEQEGSNLLKAKPVAFRKFNASR